MTMLVVLLLLFIGVGTGLRTSSRSMHGLLMSTATRDLTGYQIYISFSGFNGATNVPALFSLERDFKVRFKGVDSATPGFWRVIKYDDGRESLECNHPLIPEYLYFFDIWEPSILWRGDIDMNNMKILSGEVTTNKKRFGIFPYTETLATFTADIYPPNSDNVPVLDVPNLKDIAIIPPENFDSPYDMKQHPDVFNPEFVEWWFENEDSIANSNQEVKRPKPFWSATKTQDSSNKKDEKKDRAFGRSKK